MEAAQCLEQCMFVWASARLNKHFRTRSSGEHGVERPKLALCKTLCSIAGCCLGLAVMQMQFIASGPELVVNLLRYGCSVIHLC